MVYQVHLESNGLLDVKSLFYCLIYFYLYGSFIQKQVQKLDKSILKNKGVYEEQLIINSII